MFANASAYFPFGFRSFGLLDRARRMPAAAPTGPVHLPRHHTRSLPAGHCLRVVRGCVWVTVDGCARDLILEAGDSYLHDERSPVLMHAIDAAEITLAPAAPAPQNR